MTKQASIAYITGLMEDPSTLTDGDQGSISGYRQSYPYFVPARYLDAVDKHKKDPFSPAILSGIQPYMGNWMLFCDFMNASTGTGFAVGGVTKHKKAQTQAEQHVEADEIIAAHADEVAVEETKDNIDEVVDDSEAILAVETADVTDQGEIAIEEESNVIATTTSIEEVNGVVDLEVSADVLESMANSFWIQAEEDLVDESKEQTEEPTDEATQPDLDEAVEEAQDAPPATMEKGEKPLIFPVYTDDYFLRQGEKVPNELPDEIESLKQVESAEEAAKSLMVMMSFSEWLLHFKQSTEKQKEENRDQKALKTMWQKEKLAAAIEEENEEIPENVFEMAVNSITKEDGLSSESLAEVYVKQGKYEKAIDMYRKLSLRNPQKNTYFALKIEEILKEKQS